MCWRGRTESLSDGSTLLTSKDMKKKIAVLTLCAMLFALCGSAEAQQPTKIPRIGFLDASSASGNVVLLEVFRQEMGKLGWIEGKNIIIEYRFSEGQNDRLPELAADVVHLKVDLIVVTGMPLALAAKRATTTIPIVMINIPDPVGAGLVASLARPGGSITGFASLSPELNTKRLEILKDAVPGLLRVGLMLPPRASLGQDIQLKDLKPAALALKVKLEEIQTHSDAKELESAFQTAKQRRVNAIMTTSTRPFFAARKRIVELTGKYRLPAIYFQREFVGEGGLMSYGVDYDDLYRRTAVYVNKILKGAKPGDLPVEQPTKFEFIINLKAAKQIGLTIPPNLLARADRVIK
jgi:putative tryptophan/tyrosine transport system substrate-binding protein